MGFGCGVFKISNVHSVVHSCVHWRVCVCAAGVLVAYRYQQARVTRTSCLACTGTTS